MNVNGTHVQTEVKPNTHNHFIVYQKGLFVRSTNCYYTCISNPIYSCANIEIKWARLIYLFHVHRLPGATLSNCLFRRVWMPSLLQLIRHPQLWNHTLAQLLSHWRVGFLDRKCHNCNMLRIQLRLELLLIFLHLLSLWQL